MFVFVMQNDAVILREVWKLASCIFYHFPSCHFLHSLNLINTHDLIVFDESSFNPNYLNHIKISSSQIKCPLKLPLSLKDL